MSQAPIRPFARHRRALTGAAALLILGAAAQGDAQARREFVVTATRYEFHVSGSVRPEVRVVLGDVVRITFEAADIPHSFTTVEGRPHYRIDRRAEPGRPVTFEFKADQAGRVPIRCTLTIDERCREMTAWLIVDPK